MRRLRDNFMLGLAAVAFAALAVLPSPASAQSTDGWQFTVVPYLTGAAMKGTLGVGPVNADVEVKASDILDALEFGVMGLFGARKGNWGFGADAIYMGLGATKDFTNISAGIDVDQGAYAFYGIRRLSAVAELSFGVRWNVLSSSIALSGPGATTIKGDQQWVDPLVGLVLRTPKGSRWHATAYTEIGGFGAGSDFAWQFFPTVGFDFSRHFAIDGGWRWIGMNYETGEGLDRFAYDMVIQGPTLGFVIRF